MSSPSGTCTASSPNSTTSSVFLGYGAHGERVAQRGLHACAAERNGNHLTGAGLLLELERGFHGELVERIHHPRDARGLQRAPVTGHLDASLGVGNLLDTDDLQHGLPPTRRARGTRSAALRRDSQ